MPADAAFAALDAADEGGVGAEAVADLFLREPGLAAEFSEGSAEYELILGGGGAVGGLIHRRNGRLWPTQPPGLFWPKNGAMLSRSRSAGALRQ